MIRFIFITLLFSPLLNCGGITIHNPSATLKEIGRPSRVHIKAMSLLDASVGRSDANYQELLQRMLWVPGYTNEARLEALERLWITDREGTIRIIRQRLPRMDNTTWLKELCSWIADEDIKELHEAIISSWATTLPFIKSDNERPEYLALVRMYDESSITDLIFDSMLIEKRSWKQSYRIRCWELLHRLGQRERLMTLLDDTQFDEDDLFFIDLQKAKKELGIVPSCREEILWIRELSKPEYSSFWFEAVEALSKLDDDRRSKIEMRDIVMAVSLHRHGGDGAFSRTVHDILNNIASRTDNQKHYTETEGGGQYVPGSERLKTYRDRLTWGDAIALEMTITALDIPQVREHVFDYATRDKADTTTEYGGVLALDKKGRFEVLEFEPKIRHHDRRFNASQDMFDAAYTALFHFHFHAQKFRNGDHAGPGMGDKNYANNTRANCLVFTFVNEDTLNVDFYRHGGIVIDLGTISRQ